MYFLETIAAIGLKDGLSIQINELMKLNEYQRSRWSFDLGQKSLRFKIQTCFSPKLLSHLELNSYERLLVNGNEHLYK